MKVTILQKISRWLAANASLTVIAVAVFTFFVPDAFNWVRGNTQTVILGIIMLTMGLTLTTQDFRILAHRPWDIFIGACAQFIIMPCVAYLLVHVFRLEPALALGILLVGCCPGGVSSNIMSYLCHGDVAFSVGMTCASTLLAPVMTPLLMELTAGEIIKIDTIGMFLNILIVTIIPVAIGCFLNYTYSKKECFPTIQSLMPGLSVICLACIVGGVISTVHDDLVARGLMLFLWTFAVVFLVENRRQTPIHPVQYALVGIALILFYTLLLAFSEHIGFGFAYLVAAAMTVGLISTFIQGLTKHRTAALAVGGLLTVLYTFIYVIMQLESYALLVGSIGVFVILAVAMYASQKIKW